MTAGRAIGPIGTLSRVIGGVAFIAVPVAISGIGWWEVAAALVALPIAAGVLAALYRRFAPGALAGGDGVSWAPHCVLIAAVVAVGIAITFVSPVDGSVAIWTFLGASMLVAAIRGYAGCEVLAIPNAVSGRDDEIGCVLYTPIDLAEAARSGGRAPVSPGAPQR